MAGGSITMRYRSANAYFRQRFGCKVYKLSVSGGMTCPTRDGTKGTRGCIFCSEKGSGDFASPFCADLAKQLSGAKDRIAFKSGNAKFIVYFQDHTNTYAPVSYLEPLFTSAVIREDVVALSIATRPDCLPDDVMDMLCRLNRLKPVMIELGLQTIHPNTSAYIRRGYPLSEYDTAVCRLKNLGLEVITHMIIGLPGETPEMIAETARYIGQSGSDGIKLQLLHVLEGTDLAEEWKQGRISVLSEEAYFHILSRCIEILPPDMVIHRLTGDGPKKDLLAPLWSADKKRVLADLAEYFEKYNVLQGSLYN